MIGVAPLSAAIIIGMAIAAGLTIIVVYVFGRPMPHLTATANEITSALTAFAEAPSPSSDDAALEHRTVGSVERLGDWLSARLRLTPTERDRAELELNEMTVGSYYGRRATWAIAGMLYPLIVPLIFVIFFQGVVQIPVALPAVAPIIGAVLGWFLPSYLLRHSAPRVRAEMLESLMVYMDLVVLERMSNAAITDALQRAAEVSDQPLFIQIRRALDRADLEQELPWNQLQRLSSRLRLPELGDLVSVARMQDQGASLSSVLRARVRDLRHQWLAEQRREATRLTGRMSIFMTIPTMCVGGLFIGGPLLQIMFGS